MDQSPLVLGPISLPEPDLFVLRGPNREWRGRHLRADEVTLVVEVAHSSLARDREKAALYAGAGVSAYWLVDVDAERVEVHVDPAPGGRYRLVRIVDAGGLDVPVGGRLELADVFG